MSDLLPPAQDLDARPSLGPIRSQDRLRLLKFVRWQLSVASAYAPPRIASLWVFRVRRNLKPELIVLCSKSLPDNLACESRVSLQVFLATLFRPERRTDDVVLGSRDRRRLNLRFTRDDPSALRRPNMLGRFR